MIYAFILALVYNGISVSTTNVASLLTANNSKLDNKAMLNQNKFKKVLHCETLVH